jgi:hypothetical protein
VVVHADKSMGRIRLKDIDALCSELLIGVCIRGVSMAAIHGRRTT